MCQHVVFPLLWDTAGWGWHGSKSLSASNTSMSTAVWIFGGLNDNQRAVHSETTGLQVNEWMPQRLFPSLTSNSQMLKEYLATMCKAFMKASHTSSQGVHHNYAMKITVPVWQNPNINKPTFHRLLLTVKHTPVLLLSSRGIQETKKYGLWPWNQGPLTCAHTYNLWTQACYSVDSKKKDFEFPALTSSKFPI